MPYLVCQSCGSRAYSAAGHATVEDCPVCGVPLPRRQVTALPTAVRGATVSPSEPERSPLGPLRVEIEQRMGRVPVLFEPAFANPDVLRELWRQTLNDWLDSPVPEPFRRTLLEVLAEYSPWPWAAVADATRGHAREPGGSPRHRGLLELAARAPAPGSVATQLQDWPDPGTPEDRELLALTLRILLNGPEQEVRWRLVALLGECRYASLIATLTYLETCRMFAQAHPDLAAGASSRYRRTSDPRRVALVELDWHGAITSLSPAAETLFACHSQAVVGRPLTDLFADHAGGPLVRLVEEFARAEEAPLREQSIRTIGRRTNGETFDAHVTLANRGREGDGASMTAIVEPESDAREDQATAYRVLVGLLDRGSTALAPDEVLAAAARPLGWGFMLVWRWDDAERMLRCVSARNLSGGEVPAAVADHAGRVIDPETGNVGRAFASRTPLWEDLGGELGELASGLWLPIGAPDNVDGVLELLSITQRRPDPAVLDVFTTLARGAGAVLDQGELAPGATLSAARVAFEGAAAGMALVRIEGGKAGAIAEANRALGLLTGRDVSELVGMTVEELTHPDDVDLDSELREQLIGGHIPAYEIDKRFCRADGELFWGELSVSLVRGTKDQLPLYLVIQLSDVTERRQVEEALHTSRDRLASVFDEAPIGMALAALDNRWLQVNEALCQTFGYSEAELLTKRIPDVFAPGDVETIQRYLRQLFAGEVLGYHVETRAVRGDGEVIWVQLSVSLVHDYVGEPAYVLAEVQDITERKRIEQELEQGALLDALTGLPSPALLFDRLEQARARLKRTESPFVVMFVAADGLDAARARFGGERGDAALRELAARLVAAVRSGDTVARYGDDQFVIVCEDLEGNDEASAIATRALELGSFSVTDGESEDPVEISVTVGITVAAESADSPATLVERADAAMQLARGAGVGFSEYFENG